MKQAVSAKTDLPQSNTELSRYYSELPQYYYHHLLSRQNLHRYFNAHFESFTLRRNFIRKILRPITRRLGYSALTLSMTVAVMDAFLSQNKLDEDLLPSAGVTALTLVSKLNEQVVLGTHARYFEDMRACLRVEAFPALEKLILLSVGFNVNVVTPLHFVGLLIQKRQLSPEYGLVPQGGVCTKRVLEKLLFVVSLDYGSNFFAPLELASCVVVFFELHFLGKESWCEGEDVDLGLKDPTCGNCLAFVERQMEKYGIRGIEDLGRVVDNS